jgi:hypothetical protein
VALPLFESAWKAAEKHRHRMRGPILTDMADLECRANRQSEAAARLEDARRFLAEDYPDEPWRLAWLELVRASCLSSAGDAKAADAALSPNLAVVLERWPDDTMYGLSALRRAAAIREAAGAHAEAQQLLRRAARVAGG